MSDQIPNVTTESSEDSLSSKLPEPLAITAAQLDSKEHGRSKWLKFWWIPVAFLVPFTIFYSYMGSYALLNLAGCFRSGAIGLWTAILIYGLWQIDTHIGKVDKRNEMRTPLLGMLGVMLWLSWVSAAHIMIVANDEVTTPSVMIDH